MNDFLNALRVIFTHLMQANKNSLFSCLIFHLIKRKRTLNEPSDNRFACCLTTFECQQKRRNSYPFYWDWQHI